MRHAIPMAGERLLPQALRELAALPKDALAHAVANEVLLICGSRSSRHVHARSTRHDSKHDSTPKGCRPKLIHAILRWHELHQASTTFCIGSLRIKNEQRARFEHRANIGRARENIMQGCRVNGRFRRHVPQSDGQRAAFDSIQYDATCRRGNGQGIFDLSRPADFIDS